jgi:hypothetical protein
VGAGRGAPWAPWASVRGATWAAARGAPWAAARGAAGLGHGVGCGQRRRGARPWPGLRPEGPLPGAAAAGRAAVQYLHGFVPNCFTNFVAFTFFPVITEQGLLSRTIYWNFCKVYFLSTTCISMSCMHSN